MTYVTYTENKQFPFESSSCGLTVYEWTLNAFSRNLILPPSYLTVVVS